jgi:hypothetical protein
VKNIPKPLLALLALLIALFICSMGANAFYTEDFNPQVLDTLDDWLGDTFLGGVPIDLDEVRLASQSAFQPGCLQRDERLLSIPESTPCVYLIQASDAPIRTLNLTWESGACATVELRDQEAAVPVTLQLSNPDAEPGLCGEDADDEPQLSIRESRGTLEIICTNSGGAGVCEFRVDE